MPSVEELLSQTSDDEYADISPINDVITIDPETRTINLPASETLFGTEQEMNVERKYFKCPKIVGDNIDLSKHQIYITYVTAKDNIGTFLPDEELGLYYCEDMAVDGDYITFSWLLSGNVLRNHGFIAFAVSAKHMDGGIIKTRWKTKPAVGTVLLTVPDGVGQIANAYPDIITQLLDRMDAVEAIATPEVMQGYVNDYLVENPVKGGLSTTAVALLMAFAKSCYTSSNQDANLDALERELLGSSSGGDTPSEPDTPVDPDEPTTPTLTSISAVANETTVAVGTKAENLDITVTAHYSDGTTETITDYSISGTVGVGENTFTIVYGGKTTTVTVIGQNIPVYSLYDTTPSAEIRTGCTPFSVDQDVSIFIDITPVTISGDTSIWYVINAGIVFYQNYMRSVGKAQIVANKVSTAKIFGGEITAIGDNIKAIFTRRAGSTTYEVYWYQKKSSGAEYWTKNTDFEVGTFLPVDSEIRLTPKQTFNKFEVYTNKYTTEAEALEFTGGTAFTEV